MTDRLRAAAQAALEALERSRAYVYETDRPQIDGSMDALRTALAEPEEGQLPPLPECYVTSGGRDLWREEDLIAYGRACAALAEPEVEQEPVAWMCLETKELYDYDTSETDRQHGLTPTVPLYTAPPRREWQGLTEEEIEAAIRPLCGENESVLRQLIDFSIDEYRAIEAALKEKNA